MATEEPVDNSTGGIREPGSSWSTEDIQNVVALYFVDGRSQEEIATKYSVQQPAISKLLERKEAQGIIAELAAQLRQQGGIVGYSTLTLLARHGRVDAARVAAAKELLNRSEGAVPQVIAGDRDRPLEVNTTVRLDLTDERAAAVLDAVLAADSGEPDAEAEPDAEVD